MQKDPRIDKLPKYATQYVHVLEQRVKELEEDLVIARGQSKTKVAYDIYDGEPSYLGNNETVEFSVGDKLNCRKIRVHLTYPHEKSKSITVNGDSSIVVRPSASNQVTISIDER
jgi:hypothetical protein